MTQRQDYLERLIRQVAEVVASALGIAKSGDVARAQEELRRAWTSAVGLRREDVMRLDSATLRVLLGNKRELAVTLLEAEAQLGDGEAARVLEALR